MPEVVLERDGANERDPGTKLIIHFSHTLELQIIDDS